MAYSGIPLPGIVSPDESIEEFAKLYGNDNVWSMMIMASTIGNPYGLPGKPRLKESYNSEYSPNLNHLAYVDDRNPKMNPRYGVQTSHGATTMRHGGYGDHYNPSPAMKHPNPRYSHQQEGFAFPSAFQSSGSLRHGGYGDHYNQGVYPQQERRYPVPEHQYQYRFSPPQRYPWL